MTNSSEKIRTGYFDVLTSGYFKTAPDGRRLFYPWGAFGRGYAIPSQPDYERLRRQLTIFMIVTLVLTVGAVVAELYLAAVVIGALFMAFYAAWTPYLRRGLQPSDERLSLQEGMAAQARAYNAAVLWSLEIMSLAFVAIGVFIVVINPEDWLAGLASVGFFGLCAAVFAYMLVLRRRA